MGTTANETYLRVGIDGREAQDGSRVVVRSLDDIAKAADTSISNVTRLKDAVLGAVSAFAAWRVSQLVKDTALFAANVEAADRALQVIGNRTGHTAAEIIRYRDAVKAVNITTASATNATAQFARANLDLEKLIPLAKMAQGAAIMASMRGETISSSEAMDKMVKSIITGMTMELHQLGIMVSQRDMLRENKLATDESAASVDAHKRHQLLLNETLKHGANLMDLYAKSQDLASKQISSSKRPIEEMKLALGNLFLPEVTVLAHSFYKTVSDGMMWFRDPANASTLETLRKAVWMLADAAIHGAEAWATYFLFFKVIPAAIAAAPGLWTALTGAVIGLNQAIYLTAGTQSVATIGTFGETIVTTSARAGLALNTLKGALSTVSWVITALVAGYQFGSWLYDQFALVRKASVEIVWPLIKGWKELGFAVQQAFIWMDRSVGKDQRSMMLADLEKEREEWRKFYQQAKAEAATEAARTSIPARKGLITDDQAAIEAGKKEEAERKRLEKERTKAEAAIRAQELATEAQRLHEAMQANHEKYLAYSKAFDDRKIADMRASGREAEAVLRGQLDRNLIAEQTYLDKKYAIESAALGEELKIAKNQEKQAATDADVAAALFKKNETIEAYREMVTADKALQESMKARREVEAQVNVASVMYLNDSARSARGLRDMYADVNIQLLQLQGKLKEAGIAKLDKENVDPMAKLEQAAFSAPQGSEAEAAALRAIEQKREAIQLQKEQLIFADEYKRVTAEVALLEAQGASIEAASLRESLELRKQVLEGASAEVIELQKKINAVNELKRVQSLMNSTKNLSDELALKQTADPYTRQLKQIEQRYKRERELIQENLAYVKKGSVEELELKKKQNLLEQNEIQDLADFKKKAFNDSLASLSDSLDKAGQALMQGSKKQFEIGKKLAIASAVISTYLSAQQAFTALAGIPFVGPVLGAAAAAAAIVAGMARIDAIRNQEYTPSYAVGTSYVPEDQLANIHEGEMVIDRASSDALRKYGIRVSGAGNDGASGLATASLMGLSAAADSASLSVRRVADGFSKFKGSLDRIADLFMPNSMGKGYLPGIGEDPYRRESILDEAVRDMTHPQLSAGAALFGWGSPWLLKERGIKLNMHDGDIDGVGYSRYRKSGGLFGGPEYKTKTSKLDNKFLEELNDVLDSARDTIRTTTTALGVDLGSLNAELGSKKFNFKGKSAEAAQQMIEEWLAKAAEAAVKKGLSEEDLTTLQDAAKYGENLFDTLVRLTGALQTVNEGAELIGASLIESTIAGALAAEDLINRFGDKDKFTGALDDYFSTMFTEEEQAARKAEIAQRQVTVAFNEMGLAIPTTREGLRGLVEGLDLNTEHGRELFKALVSVAPAFDTVQKAAEEAADFTERFAKSLEPFATMADEQLSAAQDALSAAETTAAAFKQIGDSIRNAVISLKGGDLSTLTPEQKLAESRARFEWTAAAAGRGEQKALQDLPSVAQTFAEASRAYNASGVAYQTDFARILSVLEAAGVEADSQATASQYQASLLELQVNLLQDLRELLSKESPDATLLQAQLAALQGISQLLNSGSTGSGDAQADAIAALLGTAAGDALQHAIEGLDGTTIASYLGDLVTINQQMSETLAAFNALAQEKAQAERASEAKRVYDQAVTAYNETIAAAQATRDQSLQAYEAQKAETGKKAFDEVTAVTTAVMKKMIAGKVENKYGFTAADLTARNKNQELPAAIAARVAAEAVAKTQLYDPAMAIFQNVLDQQNAVLAAAREVAKAAGANIPGFAVGSDGIPRDMTARVHQDEIIMDPIASRYLQRYGIKVEGEGSGNNEELVGELQQQNATLQEMLIEERAQVRTLAAGMREMIDEMRLMRAELAEIRSKNSMERAA